MGDFLKQDDIYVDSMLNLLNLRFAPTQRPDTDATPDWEHSGGITEMAALQKEFEVFKPGSSFAKSVSVLGLGGFMNPRSRNRWFKYLEGLASRPSSQADLTGDQAIVRAIIEDLGAASPKPIHFTHHDMAPGGTEAGVKIEPAGRPVFYMPHDYVVISLPMKLGSQTVP